MSDITPVDFIWPFVPHPTDPQFDKAVPILFQELTSKLSVTNKSNDLFVLFL